MMHVGATVDSDEMFVQLEECWATPSSDPNHQTKYIFIQNFCGTDEEVNVYESLIVAQNGVANQAQFSMESFVFNDSTDAQGWAKIFIKMKRFLKILILYKTSPGRFFKILILFFTRRKEKIKSFLYNA